MTNAISTPSKVAALDFPDGAMDKNLPANTGDTDSTSGLGRFYSDEAPVPQLVSLSAATTEAQAPGAGAPSTGREATAKRSLCSTTRSSRHLPQLEKSNEDQGQPKKINK